VVLPMHVAHHLPRRHHHAARTRLKVPPGAAHRIAAKIHQFSNVTHVEANDTTGSVLVHHQGNLDGLIAHLEAEGICTLTGLPEPASEVLATFGPKVLSVALVVAVLAVVGPSWATRWVAA
jgi:hypothetical protein